MLANTKTLSFTVSVREILTLWQLVQVNADWLGMHTRGVDETG